MKKCVLIVGLLTCCCGAGTLRAQTQEVQQLLLDVEKLAQLKSILADMKKGYEMLTTGYETIKRLSQGSFDLHKGFLDRLLDVSPVVKSYKRVADIIAAQVRLVSDYKRAYKQFAACNQFAPEELNHIATVYARLFDGSLKSLDALLRVVTAGDLRMSDDERLTAIDAVWKDVQDSYAFLQRFTNETKILALQRTKEASDLAAQRKLSNVNQ